MSIKNGDFAKNSSLKKLFYARYKTVTTKATVLPENDLAIFKARHALRQCIVISLFFKDQLIYFRQNDLQQII